MAPRVQPGEERAFERPRLRLVGGPHRERAAAEVVHLARQRVEWLLVLDQVPKPCRLVASRLRKIGHPGPDARGGLRPLAVTGVTVTVGPATVSELAPKSLVATTVIV